MFKDELRFNDTKWNTVRTTSLTSSQPISFSYKLACPPDMYGPICGKGCKPSPDRYTCGNNGEKVCKRSNGWYGVECDRKLFSLFSCTVQCL